MKFCYFSAACLFMLIIACEETDIKPSYKSVEDYLSDKYITRIFVNKEDLWITSHKECDTCYIPPYACHTGMSIIFQLTLIRDSSFFYEDPSLPFGQFNTDSKGNLYAVYNNLILKITDLGKYDTLVEINDFQIRSFAFDKYDNIWMSGHQGICYWDGINTIIFNKNNSILPANITYGPAIDKNNNVWIALASEGILKITGNVWDFIAYSEIPGLGSNSHLLNPLVDNADNIWFNVSDADTNSSILKFDGSDWDYQYPDENAHGFLAIDSKKNIWVIKNNYENNVYFSYISTTLYYFKDNVWNNILLNNLETPVFTMNKTKDNIYLGMEKGLRIIKL
jgi:hypothetical protein